MLVTGAPGVLPAIPEENAAGHVGCSERVREAQKRVGGCGDREGQAKEGRLCSLFVYLQCWAWVEARPE